LPASAWNYGLILDPKEPAKTLHVIRNRGRLPSQPFTLQTAPIQIRAEAKKIPAWKLDHQGLIGKLQPSPVKSDQPIERVTLIPMGAARLRVSSFPLIGEGPDARDWTVPKAPPVTASHCFENDSVEALIDGQEPNNSNDRNIPRFTWWPRRGTSEWVQQDFPTARQVSSAEVYWFDDTGTGSCRVPSSWKLYYKAGDRWKEVENPAGYGTAKDQFNRVTFSAIQTRALKIEAQLQTNFSAGILEWKLNE
jgi:hypothetical protein